MAEQKRMPDDIKAISAIDRLLSKFPANQAREILRTSASRFEFKEQEAMAARMGSAVNQLAARRPAFPDESAGSDKQ